MAIESHESVGPEYGQMATELHFGQVIKKGNGLWVVTQQVDHGYFAQAVEGYKPGEPLDPAAINIRLTHGSNTLMQGEPQQVVGSIPADVVIERARHHIATACPEPLRPAFEAKVADWARPRRA